MNSRNEQPRRPIGRPPVPTKLTPALTKQVCRLIASGMSLEASSYACDITPQTLFGWLRKGKQQSSGVYYDFFLAIKKAQAAFEFLCLKRLQAQSAWTRQAWLLERKFPDRWGRREPRERKPPEKEPGSIDDVVRRIKQVLGYNTDGEPIDGQDD